jgi:NAD(P)-dependent dehydrogenase (short-subunit alcohol dehydrogenase family)
MVDGIANTSAALQLAGRRAIVATQGLAVGHALARGLKRHGARLVELDAPFGTQADAEAAMADAAREFDGADLVVHAAALPAALECRSLDALTVDDWRSAVHRSMLATLFCLQGAHRVLHERGGSVVLVGPSTALVGAAGLVPLMTLAEGQRSLIKSAARQWGRHGMRLNWVGVAPRHYAPRLADAPVPAVPELGPPPPALGRVPEPPADVADVIAWLGSEGARAITGASFNLDGGDWMVP